MNPIFKDLASSNLGADLTSGSTTIALAAGGGALFPVPSSAEQSFFAMTLNDVSTGQRYEVVYVTAVVGDNLTVLRGQEGTTAQSWSVGDFVYHGPTAVIQSAMLALSNVNYPPATAYTVPLSQRGVLQKYTAHNGVINLSTAVLAAGSLIPIEIDTGSSVTINAVGGTLIMPTKTATSVVLVGPAFVGFMFDGTNFVTAYGSTQLFGSGSEPFSNEQVYSNPGSYTFTAPVTGTYHVEIVGAGGAGNSSNTSNPMLSGSVASGGSGAAGGYGRLFISLTAGQTVPITVGQGAAGAGVTNANSGGSTSFGSYMTATGGGGSAWGGQTTPGGIGGTCTGGYINVTGGDGEDGQFQAFVNLASGGASYFGGGGRAGIVSGTPSGHTGQAPGSGGGGTYSGAPGDGSIGGGGANGLVIIKY